MTIHSSELAFWGQCFSRSSDCDRPFWTLTTYLEIAGLGLSTGQSLTDGMREALGLAARDGADGLFLELDGHDGMRYMVGPRGWESEWRWRLGRKCRKRLRAGREGQLKGDQRRRQDRDKITVDIAWKEEWMGVGWGGERQGKGIGEGDVFVYEGPRGVRRLGLG